jgi:pimeloyl-ACP methyl ester carboxylesterase
MTGLVRQQHHIVYIPGLGDTKSRGQAIAVRLWRTFGVYGHCHPVIWSNAEAFQVKLSGVLQEIDDLLAQGHIVSLMGASAGASMALHAYAARKTHINGVVLVCGELADAKTINPSYYAKNAAFQTSMERLPATIAQLTPSDRARIMSLHPLYDETVHIKDTRLDGARMYTSITFGHAFTIGLTLTLDFYIPLWFLSSWARKKY